MTLASVNATLPAHYIRLYEMIAATRLEPSATSLLELGCSSGEFVNFLRSQGYNAEGVDGDSEAIESAMGRYDSKTFHYGELTALEDVFGNRKFDIIVSQGVFCVLSQLAYLLRYPKKRGIAMKSGAISHNFSQEADSQLQEVIDKILANTHRQLTPRGLLIAREAITPYHRIDFSQETATKLGFVVNTYSTHEAILEK